MTERPISKLSLVAGIVFTVAGIIALRSGYLRSATIAEFRVSGDSARAVGTLLIIMGAMLLFDCIRKRLFKSRRDEHE